MSTVFISGSISIKKLPEAVENSLRKIIREGMEILIGDADGIDSIVQNFCKRSNYGNVTVYSIYPSPRFMARGFRKKHILVTSSSKKERQLQQEKDAAMTIDSDYSFVIWDGKSKGSYHNLIRAIECNKKIKLYLTEIDGFLEQNMIKKSEIEYIYRKNNGYTASEVVTYLKSEGETFFPQTRSLNKFLLEHGIIKKEDGVYLPMPDFEELFIIDKYRGRVRGIKFKNEFIGWLEDRINKLKQPEEQSLF